jgi:hypothetical protein
VASTKELLNEKYQKEEKFSFALEAKSGILKIFEKNLQINKYESHTGNSNAFYR